jgi:hypothetical protein
MVKIRPSAALAGLIVAIVMLAGAFSSSADARPMPATRVTGSPTARAAVKVRPPRLGSPRVAVTRHYGQVANASGFSVILATGPGQAWAFGGTNPGGPSSPVAAQWNGTILTPSALPTGLTGFISDASAPAPGDVWAASQYGHYVLHWDGQHWSIAGRWRRGEITGLTAIGPRNVWVFGATDTGSRLMGTWHFNGTSWQLAAGPARAIYRGSAISRHDIWAIAASRAGTVVLRYSGRWRIVRTGGVLAGVLPSDVLAISDQDVWVAGDVISQNGTPHLVLAHWNGAHWSRLAAGLQAWAGRLAPGPNGGVLLTATPANAAATGLILHASPQGWGGTTVVQSSLGSGVSDVAMAPGSRSLWATGGILTRLGGDAAIWSAPLAPPGGHASAGDDL